MSSETRPNPMASLLLVALMAAVGGGVLLKNRKLEPERPPPLRAVPGPVDSEQWLDARLSQDPVRAVGRSYAEASGRVSAPVDPWSRFAAHVRSVSSVDGGDPVPVLAVFLTGGDGAEAVEERRRARFAVLSALAVSGFVPVDSGRLGALPFPPVLESPGGCHGDGCDGSLQGVIPFEWFRHDPLAESTVRRAGERSWARDVAVLWLEETNRLRRYPLAALAALQGLLDDAVAGRSPGCGSPGAAGEGRRAVLKVIGPASSDLLRSMLEEEAPREARWRYRMERELPDLVAGIRDSVVNGDHPPVAGDAPLDPDLLGTCERRLRDALRRYSHAATRTIVPAGFPADEWIRAAVRERCPEGIGADEWSSHVAWYVSALDERGFFLAFPTAGEAPWPDDPSEDAVRRAETERWRSEVAEQLAGLEVYSPRATAAQPLVLATDSGGDEPPRPRSGSGAARAATGRSRPAGESDGNLTEALGARGIRYVPGNLTDDRLAERLVEELLLRGVDLSRDGDHVVLVSEWDTFYGRALPLTFAAAVERHRRDPTKHLYSAVLSDLVGGSAVLPDGIEVYSYLRGIDGERARLGEGESLSQAGRDAAERDRDRLLRGEVNPAFGLAHLDYMSRLGRTLQVRNRELRREGRRGIRAIGILGSDVYDKLLVLQALRSQFPEAVFFTTDLDARLLEPSRYQWTRNLVVASAFGLELGRHLHRGLVPPFRDSYQVATFLSCLTALGRFSESDLVHELRPRLFEVGRTGAVDLSTASDDSFLNVRPHRIPSAVEVVTPAAVLLGGALLLLLPFSPLLKRHAFLLQRPDPAPGGADATAVAVPTGGPGGETLPEGAENADGRPIDEWNRERRTLLRVLLGGAVAMGLMVLVVTFANAKGTGEPFAILEGVSAWPTEMLRLLAAIVAVLLFAEGYFEIRRSDREISDAYGLGRPPRRVPESPKHEDDVLDCRAGVLERARALCRLPPGCGGDCPPPDAREPVLVRAGRELRCLLKVLRHDRNGAWRRPAAGTDATVDARALWHQYLARGTVSASAWRVVPNIVLYMALGSALVAMFGRPALPLRGAAAFAIDRIVLTAAVLLVVSITFFVVDAMLLCQRFARHLFSGDRITWPVDVRDPDRMWSRRPDVTGPVEEAIAIRLLATRTETIGRLILYPFVVTFVMILSRHELFDNWNWPPSLVVIIGLILVISLVTTVVLRRSAEAGRRETVQRLRDEILSLLGRAPGAPLDAAREGSGPDVGGAETPDAGDRIDQLKILMDEVRQMRRGALSPITEHPIIAAILMPFGGVGVLALVELLVKM